MIDIESYGLGGFPTIIQIGAVAFEEETYKVLDTFCVNVSPESCERLGSLTSEQTKAWWVTQGGLDTKGEFEHSITIALNGLRYSLQKWSDYYGDLTDVVANGIQFDIAAIETYVLKLGMEPLWHYQAGTDQRTLFKFAKRCGFKSQTPYKKVSHHALEDCIQQIERLQEVEEYLSKCTGMR
jgi:oligoribonuclease (3'-5' exoribonuclease)